MVMTALTLSASASEIAPWSPMPQPSRLRIFKTALTLSASAIAAAHSAPRLLSSRFSDVSAPLTWRASPIALMTGDVAMPGPCSGESAMVMLWG